MCSLRWPSQASRILRPDRSRAGGWSAARRTVVCVVSVVCSLLGLALGAWLSFPVAVLVLLIVYVLGISSNFISDAMSWEAERLYAQVVNVVIYLLPGFSAYDPVPLIEKGRLVSFDILTNLFIAVESFVQDRAVPEYVQATTALVKDFVVVGVVSFAGYLIFRFRELARVIV